VKLVDTSAWVEYLRDTKSKTNQRVKELVAVGEAAWCEIIALELANCSKASEVGRLERLRQETWMFEIDWRVWAMAQRMAVAARAKAVTVPVADLVIAACGRSYDLEIEHHGDSHFDMLDRISIR
jgi:predicted nucleic acid-binding protein